MNEHSNVYSTFWTWTIRHCFGISMRPMFVCKMIII